MQKFILVVLSCCALIACQSSTVSRAPNSAPVEFDSGKVGLLKWAAKNRILFQIPDTAFEDVASSSVDNACKKLETPAWASVVYSALEFLKKNPTLAQKIHIIEVKSGEVAMADTSQDLDGLTYLQLTYNKQEQKTKIENLNQVPCDNKHISYLNQERTDTRFIFPTQTQITNAVKKVSLRETPDRWAFKTEFLTYLAERMTIFKLNPEVSFERSAQGESFLVSFLNEQSKNIKAEKFMTFDYWLSELSVRSHSASYLKIFGLVRDKELNFGMASLPQSKGLSYPYLSYKVQDGHYTYTSLVQLDKCLSELSSRYKRSLASINSDLSTLPESFLSPGYTCR